MNCVDTYSLLVHSADLIAKDPGMQAEPTSVYFNSFDTFVCLPASILHSIAGPAKGHARAMQGILTHSNS
jgi:hypothetical protein